MEAYLVSGGKPQPSLTSSRQFSIALLPVQSSSMIAQCSALQVLRLTLRYRSRSRYRQCSGAGVRGALAFVAQQQRVLSKSVRVCDTSVGEFEAHGHNRILAFDCAQYTQRRCSRKISRSVVHAAAPCVLNADVLSRKEHFQRLEKFYDGDGFLLSEEIWDVDGKEISSLWEEHIGNVMAAAQVEDGSRVLSWGGSPALIRQLSVTCPESLVISHCSLSMLSIIKESDDDIICWHGDIVDMPSSSYGSFDSVFLNSLPALSVSPVQLLQAVVGLCRPGARIVISSSQGKKSLAAHREENPEVVLHDLPDLASLEKMIAGLPLKIVVFHNDSSYFLTALEVTQQASLFANLNERADSSAANTIEIRSNRTFKLVPNYPLRVRGHIVRGFGRGSRQMGIPTANVDPEQVPEDVLQLPKGVYCGWAQVHGEGLDKGVHKMVMNIGNRPTFADGGGVSVEVHILHDYGDVDFYGERLSFVILGYIREEMKFKSPGELVRRIHTDLKIARKGLDEEDMQQFAADELFHSR